jgi:hypothetical protein
VVIALLVVGAVMMCAFFVCEWKIASLPILPCKLDHFIGQLSDFVANALFSTSVPHTNRIDCAGAKLSRRRHILRQHILRSHVFSVRHGILGSQNGNSYPRLHITTIALRYRIGICHIEDELVQGSHHIRIGHLDPGCRTSNYVDARLITWTGHWNTRGQLYRCRVLSPV